MERELLKDSALCWPKEDVRGYVTVEAGFRIEMRNCPFWQTVLATT